MKFETAALLVMSGIAYATPAMAQVQIEANGARADGRWGGELGIGYSIGVGGFSLTPSVGALIYFEDNGRYYRDDNGGNDRCRDYDTGQYADDELCNNTQLKPYGRVEATYTFPFVATLGAGFRIGNDIRPYGTFAIPVAPKVRLKGNGGPHYYALGLSLKF